MMDGEQFAAGLRAKGIPCTIRPRLTEEQRLSRLQAIKAWDERRGILNNPIGVMGHNIRGNNENNTPT